jgi:hypothetical protein
MATAPGAAGVRLVQIVGFVAILTSLSAYLALAFGLGERDPDQIVAGNEMAFYILLTLAFVFPAWWFVGERLIIRSFRKESPEVRQKQRAWLNLAIVRIAVIEVSFFFGLTAVMLTGELNRFWVFFAIGAVWAAVWWPTPGRIVHLIEKVDAP